jgi:hypothetical protein
MTPEKRPALPPAFKRYFDVHDNLITVLKYLTPALLDEKDTFRGLTMFQGDNNAYVVGVKRWGFDGRPEIIWSSGKDPLDALIAVDLAIKTGSWKVDKRAEGKAK